ncbi:hypothetical protein M5689_011671 [Euphorbia peplus]|nr:hypothetical protein M5689_011671 [Euphorbia peplus]
MTRSAKSEENLFDPEIEKTAKRLRKESRLRNTASLAQDESSSSESEVEEVYHEEEIPMAERTLRQLQTYEVNNQPLCIRYPNLDVSFELKSELIHLLPKFHGIESESPHKHLKQFHVVCSSMRPQGVTEEQVKL